MATTLPFEKTTMSSLKMADAQSSSVTFTTPDFSHFRTKNVDYHYRILSEPPREEDINVCFLISRDYYRDSAPYLRALNLKSLWKWATGNRRHLQSDLPDGFKYRAYYSKNRTRPLTLHVLGHAKKHLAVSLVSSKPYLSSRADLVSAVHYLFAPIETESESDEDSLSVPAETIQRWNAQVFVPDPNVTYLTADDFQTPPRSPEPALRWDAQLDTLQLQFEYDRDTWSMTKALHRYLSLPHWKQFAISFGVSFTAQMIYRTALNWDAQGGGKRKKLSTFDQKKDYKSLLNEFCMLQKLDSPIYLITKLGPDHQPVFTGSMVVGDRLHSEVMKPQDTKKACEQLLAYRVLTYLAEHEKERELLIEITDRQKLNPPTWDAQMKRSDSFSAPIVRRCVYDPEHPQNHFQNTYYHPATSCYMHCDDQQFTHQAAAYAAMHAQRNDPPPQYRWNAQMMESLTGIPSAQTVKALKEEMTNHVEHVTTTVDNASDKFTKSVEKLTDQGIKVNVDASSLSKVMDQLQSCIEGVTTTFREKSPDAVKWVERLIALITCLWSLSQAPNASLQASIAMCYITASGFTGQALKLFTLLFGSIRNLVIDNAIAADAAQFSVSKVAQMVQDEDDPTHEIKYVGEVKTPTIKFGNFAAVPAPVASSESPETENVFFAMVHVLKHMFQSTTPFEKQIDNKRVAALSSYARLFKHTKDAFTFLTSILTTALYTLYEWIFGVPYAPAAAEKIVTQAMDWTNRTCEFLTTQDYEKATVNARIFNDAEELLTEGTSIGLALMSIDTLKHQMVSYHRTMDGLKVYHAALQLLHTKQKSRQRPVCVHFVGLPFAGKSTLSEYTAKAYTEAKGEIFNDATIYYRQASREFWDRWANQKVTIFNDIWTEDTPEARTAAARELMGCVDDASYPLNMAAISDKTTAQFTSNLVIVNSNWPPIPNNCHIQNKIALRRRRDLVYYVITPELALANPRDTWFDTGKDGKGPQRYQPPVYNKVDMKKPKYDSWMFYKIDQYNDKMLGNAPMHFADVLVEIMQTEKDLQKEKVGLHQMLVDDKSMFAKLIAENKTRWEAHLGCDCKKDCPHKVLDRDEFAKALGQTTVSDKQWGDYQMAMSLDKKLKEHQSLEKAVMPPLKEVTPEKRLDEAKQNLKKSIDETKGLFFQFKNMQAIALAKEHPIKSALAVIGALGIVGGFVAYQKYNSFSHLAESYFGTTAGAFIPAKWKKKHQIVPGDQTWVAHMEHIAQSQSVVDHRNLMKHNLLKVGTYGKDGALLKTHGMFVFGRTFLTVAHMLRNIPGDVLIECPKLNKRFHRSKLSISYCDQSDLALVTILDNQVPMFRNIKDHFIRDVDLNFDLGLVLKTFVLDDDCLIEDTVIQPTPLYEVAEYRLTLHGEKQVIQNTSSFVAKGESVGGDCGRMYITCNDAFGNRRILGPHIAGGNNSHEIVGAFATQEMIDNAYRQTLEKLKQQPSEETIKPPPMKAAQVGAIKITEFDSSKLPFAIPELKDNVTLIGNIEPTTWVGNETKYRKSPIYGHFMLPKEFPSITTPRTNKDGTVVYPALNAFLKANRDEVKNYDEQLLRDIADHIKLRNRAEVKYPPRVLSLDEALNGIKGSQYLGPIKRNTSIGYPTNVLKERKGKGKTGYVHLDPETNHFTLDEEIANDVAKLEAHYIDPLANPDKPVSIWCDNLKTDERIALKKIYDVNTQKWVLDPRLHSTPPFHLLLTSRRYTGAEVENTGRNHNNPAEHSALGINPFSYEWGLLYRHLRRFGHFGHPLAGDFKKYDASIPAILTELSWEITEDYYKQDPNWKPEDELVRKGLCKDTHQAQHVLINLLYQLKFHVPSGTLRTTKIDGDGIDISLTYAILINARERNIPMSIEEAHSLANRLLKTFGDDHIGVLNAFNIPWFSMIEYRRIMKTHFGMEYTALDKGEDLPPFVEWDKLNFLGRSFVPRNGLVFAPLDLEILYDALNWVTVDGLSYSECFDAVCDSILREFFHHGREAFYEFRTELNAARGDAGYKPLLLEWDTLLAAFLGFGSPMQPGLDTSKWDAQMSEPKSTTTLAEKSQVTTPLATEVTPTATFGDLVGIETPTQADPPPTNIREGNDPYPSQGMEQVLKRVYLVATITWSGASQQEDYLTELSFPALLSAIPNIQDKLNRFQFFRADVIVSIRINGTSFHYGALQVSMIPHYKRNDNLNFSQSIYSSSALDCSILSANAPATLEIMIPYCAPSRYWNMSDSATTTADGFFGKIFFHVLAPLRLIGAGTTPTLPITVFARFENPEVAGPVLRTAALDKVHESKHGKVEVDEDNNSVESLAKATEQLKLAAQKVSELQKNPRWKAQSSEQNLKTEAKSLASKYAKKTIKLGTNLISDVGSLASSSFDSALNGLGGLTDKPTDLQVITKVMPTGNPGFAYSKGIDQCEVLSMDPENFVANDYSVYRKPLDYNLFSNYKRVPGLIAAGSFDATAVQNDRIFTIPVNPTWVHTDADVTTQFWYPTPLANLADKFSFWTGDVQYHIVFYTSKFITGRVAIKWLPDPTVTAALTNDEFGDTISHVIDFTGDSSFSFSIPWLQERDWTNVQPYYTSTLSPVTTFNGNNGQIILSVIIPPQTSDSLIDAEVFYALWVAGGPSFRVSKPQGISITDNGSQWYQDGTSVPPATEKSSEKKAEPSPKWNAQMSDGTTLSVNLRSLFEKPFPSLIDSKVQVQIGIQNAEEVTSFTDYCKRWELWKSAAQASSINPFGSENFDPYQGNYGPDFMIPLWRILRSFHFKKGSTRYMVYFYRCSQPLEVYARNSQAFTVDDPSGIVGMAVQRTSIRPTLQWQVPFYHTYPFTCLTKYDKEVVMHPYGYWLAVQGDSAAAYTFNWEWYVSLGDDFSMGWPVPPVILAYEFGAQKTIEPKKPIALNS